MRIWGGINIVPEHIWKDVDPLTFTFYDPEQGWPVGTGPYKLDSVSPTEFVYVRDDNWWGAQTGFMDLPKPEKLIWTWAGPEETRAALMASGQLDSLMDITLGALLALQEQNPNVITWFQDMPKAWVPDPCSRVFMVNHLVEPWNDPNMRWALNYALDRDQIVEIAYEGTTLKSRHFFPAYPPLDALVVQLYHQTMDQRVTAGRPAGDSHTGRHLYHQLRAAGVEVLAAGSSDWVVLPRPGANGQMGYPADEAYFIHFIIHTISTALAGHPALHPARFAAWIAERHAQVERGELVYIAHQLDYLGRKPSP